MLRTVLLIGSLLFVCYCAPADQKITSLPGIDGEIPFDMYSGYINIDETQGKNLFYWFVESQGDPSTDPVLIWMNGGPGASSLLGFFSEHGPFRPKPNGKDLEFYDYSWNKFANVIYLESPVGVGFSYSDTPSNYITDDARTAADAYTFLEMWFEAFPEFLSNDFYITGESYAGHYCPQLASVLLDHIQNGTSSINMKGLLVGNPVTDDDWYFRSNEWSYFTTLYTHGLLPEAAYVETYNTCGWTDFLNPEFCAEQDNTPSEACLDAVYTTMFKYLPYDEMDPFDIYAPLCQFGDVIGASSESDTIMKTASMNLRKYISGWNTIEQLSVGGHFSTPSGVTFYPCIDNFMTSYLNQPDVQEAIHVNPTQWDWLGNIEYLNSSEIVVPLYNRFIDETDWRILIFSGDVDSAVPFLGTQRWISCLGADLVHDWSNWRFNHQIAGSHIIYDGISFLTIKGCGHMVPYYCPERGLEFYKRFLVDGDFTSN